MSTSIYKVEYTCDCGIDYGSCGAKCAIILKSNNTVDVYNLYHTDAHRYLGNDKEPKTEEGGLNCFGDAYLTALGILAQPSDQNPGALTESERKVIFGK